MELMPNGGGLQQGRQTVQGLTDASGEIHSRERKGCFLSLGEAFSASLALEYEVTQERDGLSASGFYPSWRVAFEHEHDACSGHFLPTSLARCNWRLPVFSSFSIVSPS